MVLVVLTCEFLWKRRSVQYVRTALYILPDVCVALVFTDHLSGKTNRPIARSRELKVVTCHSLTARPDGLTCSLRSILPL